MDRKKYLVDEYRRLETIVLDIEIAIDNVEEIVEEIVEEYGVEYVNGIMVDDWKEKVEMIGEIMKISIQQYSTNKQAIEILEKFIDENGIDKFLNELGKYKNSFNYVNFEDVIEIANLLFYETIFANVEALIFLYLDMYEEEKEEQEI